MSNFPNPWCEMGEASPTPTPTAHRFVKLLKETYKTHEGARKRCGFENGVAKGEFERGHKARHYHYRVVERDGAYRVARFQRV